jgi:hypothetical protein
MATMTGRLCAVLNPRLPEVLDQILKQVTALAARIAVFWLPEQRGRLIVL